MGTVLSESGKIKRIFYFLTILSVILGKEVLQKLVLVLGICFEWSLRGIFWVCAQSHRKQKTCKLSMNYAVS